jgi:hypothetical protein
MPVHEAVEEASEPAAGATVGRLVDVTVAGY